MMIMMIRIRIKGQCTDLFHLIKIIDTMVGKSMQQSIGFVRPEEFLHSALPFFSRFRGDRHHDDVEDSYDGMLVTMSIMVAMMMMNYAERQWDLLSWLPGFVTFDFRYGFVQIHHHYHQSPWKW